MYIKLSSQNFSVTTEGNEVKLRRAVGLRAKNLIQDVPNFKQVANYSPVTFDIVFMKKIVQNRTKCS